jgi:hypothetical protein
MLVLTVDDIFGSGMRVIVGGICLLHTLLPEHRSFLHRLVEITGGGQFIVAQSHFFCASFAVRTTEQETRDFL